jgi:hypothetical protein
MSVFGGRFVVTAKTAKAAKRLPSRVRVGFRTPPRRKASARALWATRSIRAGREVTYDVMVVAIRKPVPKRATAAREVDIFDLIFSNGRAEKCPECGHVGMNDICDKCPLDDKKIQGWLARQVDTAKPAEFKKASDFFAGGPDARPLVFDSGPDDANVDPTLSTGNWDDGHSFGWNIAPNSTALGKVMEHFADDIAAGNQSMLIPDVEGHSGIDMNGDGSTSDPRCLAHIARYEPLEITSPPSGQVAYYSFPTKIPNELWYDRQYGDGAGGCDNDQNGTLQANIQIGVPGAGTLSWNHDYEPFPANDQGQATQAQSGRWCPRVEEQPDGSMKTVERCTVGIPSLSRQPPPDQGHLGSTWPRASSGDPYFSIVVGVGNRGAGGVPGTVEATIQWRPKP